ncbi:MAG TPA: ABC transporter permease [Spirochaetota bacterium]|nr:ABC transporter permease [Spirochaetota bacterium]HPU88234.1 ABC transporter permease [Spirochaetota bacterium]
MHNIIKIAIRNLVRYRRRTLLTASLITIGVVFVIVFIAVSGSFKNMMIGQITDSMLGHIQIHKKGYVSSIDNLPLNLALKEAAVKEIGAALDGMPNVEAYSVRIKFGGMFSNFAETTNIRLNAVYPEKEFKTVPLLIDRIIDGKKGLQRGEIFIPELLAKGMNVKPGDTAVIIATNRDGSVNGKQFIVTGVLGSLSGPGGRDGYIHYEDGVELLRMDEPEASEIAVRLKDFGALYKAEAMMKKLLVKNANGDIAGLLEVHTWETLSPFFNIAKMIDVMTVFIRIMLVAIVLVSIMNVMIMAVYERIREIGTIAAIGTMPGKILSMFMVEGLCLGAAGSVLGGIIGVIVVFAINIAKVKFNFGMQTGLVLKASVNPSDLFAISIIVIIISLIASLQPAFKASRMEPITALRHV